MYKEELMKVALDLKEHELIVEELKQKYQQLRMAVMLEQKMREEYNEPAQERDS